MGGQNRRTVSFLGSELGLGPMNVLFGCGATPSLPAVSETGDKQRSVGLMSSSQQAESHVALLLLSACGVCATAQLLAQLLLLLLSVVVGSKISCKYQKSEPLLAA